ncbi:MAG: carbohydrate ABC transporter permease [Eubacteriales bacterium]|nr:carbohydrate ABC transporter permease [Eubacteriales bacterium]
MKKTMIKRSSQSTSMLKGHPAVDTIIHILLVMLAFSMIFPFYNMILISFAKYADVARGNLYIWPKSIDLTNYRVIFSDPKLMNAFKVSIFNVLFGTTLSMVITTMAGYAFSKRTLPGRRWLLMIFVITMYFSGGLIPWYLVLLDLGFVDNLFVMTVPASLSVFNMILMFNYFKSVPESLEESARIDGAGDFRILVQIILPVSMPVVATIGLFYAVGFWNEWWTAMLTIQKNVQFVPLQLLLRRIVIETTLDLGTDMANQFRNQNINVYKTGMQMAAVTVSTVPILLVYPFVQKYFTSGIMLGAIKA